MFLYKVIVKVDSYLDKLYVIYLKRICKYKIGKNCKISRKCSFKGLYASISIGDNCNIEPLVRFKFVQSINKNKFIIDIGENVFIGYGTIIDAGNKITIGKNSMIGPSVFITDANHTLKDKGTPIAKQGGTFTEVKIGENVWVASHCQVLSGSFIGNNSIVAANSTTNSMLKEDSLITGIPAKVKKSLFL